VTVLEKIDGHRDRDSPRCAIGLGDSVIGGVIRGRSRNMTDSVKRNDIPVGDRPQEDRPGQRRGEP
jgi:hypothetical protein